MPVPAERANAYRVARLWGDRRLCDGVELASRRRPRALAVAGSERSATREDPARRVSAGASAPLESGMRRGASAVLISGNTVASVIAYHSILRSGATGILLDRRCGPADLRHALELAG